mgnify:CR=1 FL=1
MKKRIPHQRPRHWCSAHQTNERRLNLGCPRCGKDVHVHENDVKRVKRGAQYAFRCTSCNGRLGLLVALKGTYITLAQLEDGLPVRQLTLDGKAH